MRRGRVKRKKIPKKLVELFHSQNETRIRTNTGIFRGFVYDISPETQSVKLLTANSKTIFIYIKDIKAIE